MLIPAKYHLLDIRLLLLAVYLFSLPLTSLASELRSASELDYPPFAIVDKQGRADGFAVELLSASSDEMGYTVNFKVGPWYEIKQALVEGHLDVLPLVAITEERKAYFDFTTPYLTIHGTIVVHEDNNTVKEIADLKSLRVGVMRGDSAEEYLRLAGFREWIVMDSYEAALYQLNSGKVDAVVAPRLVALQLIENLSLNRLKSIGNLEDYHQEFAFAAPKGNTALIEELNEGLAIINTNGRYQQIYDKWLGVLEYEVYEKYIYPAIITLLVILLVSLLLIRAWHVTLKRKIDESGHALKESEDFLRTVYNAAETVALITTDLAGKDTRILSFSPGAEKMLGYRADELIGKPVACLHLGDDTEQFEPMQAELKLTQKGFSGESVLLSKSSEQIPVHFTLQPIVKHGEVVGTLGVSLDISELKKTSEALKHTMDQAEKANLSKSEFLANMSHELRTPLHGILSYAQFGSDKLGQVPEEKIEKYFSQINVSGKRLKVLLDDLLDLSKLEAGKMVMEMEFADIHEVIESCVNEQQALIDKHHLKVEEKFDDGIPSLLFDHNRIGQVVMNLLGNAIKFSPEEGIILISGFMDSLTDPDGNTMDAIHISLSDNGSGIPPGEEEAIFDKFIQSSKTSTSSGTGLGLAISRELVHAHHGQIWCENGTEGGAVFHFLLPTQQTNIKRHDNALG